MRRRRSLQSRILFCTVIGMLLCSIFATEIPELLSLTDSTSNDFTVTVRDAATRASVTHTSTQAGTSNAFDLNHFVDAAGLLHSHAHENTTPVSADLQYLHSVLRT
jgi:hypothetical protein